MSEIKAGGAFIEIGARVDAFEKALSGIGGKLRGFVTSAGQELAGLGKSMSMVGAAITAPLTLSAKAFANYAEELSNMKIQTGLSTAALAGLKVAAEGNNIPFKSVALAVKEMQKSLAAPTDSSNDALARLGLSANGLLALKPEEQLGAIAEALSKIEDPALKATLAQEALGRSGTSLLPILADGAKGLNEYARQADKGGLNMTEAAMKKGLAADAAFDKLAMTFTSLKIAVGEALAPFTPMIEAFGNLILAAGQWAKNNPELVTGFMNLGLAITGIGVAFYAIGTAIAAIMSPVGLAIAAIVSIGMAALAVTDTLGVTQTGFGNLFNSIRIDGTGLGTWLSSFWIMIESGFQDAFTYIQTGAELLWVGLKNGVRGIGQIFLWMYEKIFEGWDWVEKKITAGLNSLIEAYNSFAEMVGQQKIEFRFKASGLGGALSELMGAWKDKLGAANSKDWAGFKDDVQSRKREMDMRAARNRKRTDALFLADPQDNTTGISIDTSRMKAALGEIGANLGQGLQNALGSATAALGGTGQKTASGEEAKPFGAPQVAPGGPVFEKPEFSALGTFSGSTAESIVSSGVFARQIDEQRKGNDFLRQIADNTREAGGGLG